ncbi:MAG: hypothetical protein H6672_09310 [Anaerolineaceae bacterium]|nr:hypothetical protein [Anaerolineaceae bacterium]
MSNMSNDLPNEIDSGGTGSLLWGFIIGALAGGIVTLFRSTRPGLLVANPRSLEESVLQETSKSPPPVDPVAASIAEGRAAARRRRVEMGLE